MAADSSYPASGSRWRGTLCPLADRRSCSSKTAGLRGFRCSKNTRWSVGSMMGRRSNSRPAYPPGNGSRSPDDRRFGTARGVRRGGGRPTAIRPLRIRRTRCAAGPRVGRSTPAGDCQARGGADGIRGGLPSARCGPVPGPDQPVGDPASVTLRQQHRFMTLTRNVFRDTVHLGHPPPLRAIVGPDGTGRQQPEDGHEGEEAAGHENIIPPGG
jgi:hypothetical protein